VEAVLDEHEIDPTGMPPPRQMTLLKPVDAAAVTEFADKVRSALGSDVLDLRLFGSKATGRPTR
jgi:hypothetical protein